MSRKTQKIIISLVIFIISVFLTGLEVKKQPGPQVLGTTNPGYYRVLEVADGDTIVVDMAGNKERIRLIGVDTPETHDPRKAVQCFGRVASDYTTKTVLNQQVRLESDELSSNRDRYDRLLRYVYLEDGRLLQAEIIKAGYGFAYTSFPFTKSDEFKRLEIDAMQHGRGLWGTCQIDEKTNGQRSTVPE